MEIIFDKSSKFALCFAVEFELLFRYPVVHMSSVEDKMPHQLSVVGSNSGREGDGCKY